MHKNSNKKLYLQAADAAFVRCCVRKDVLRNFAKIRRKTPVPGSPF